MGKAGNTKCWRRFMDTDSPMHCYSDSKLALPFWKAIRQYSEKLLINIPCGPANPLSRAASPGSTHRDALVPSLVCHVHQGWMGSGEGDKG